MGLFDRFRRGGDSEEYVFPIDRTNERSYPADFDGDIFVWDIDKTYLVSEFDSFRGLLTIPFEFAVDKRNIAGTESLLRTLRRGVDDPGESRPLYFISASPAQLRKVIERKMLLDGVEYDGITFKDHLALLRDRRMGHIRHQLAYKLCGLLTQRADLPETAREYLFGDDSEADALIYSLYGDIVAGRLRGDDLSSTLKHHELEGPDIAHIVRLSEDLPAGDVVRRIYINLEKRSPPSRFAAWGTRLIACYDTFQMALHLHADGLVPDAGVVDVGRTLRDHYNHSDIGLLRSALDLVQRHCLSLEHLAGLWPLLAREGLVPKYVELNPEAAEPEAASAERPPDFLTPTEHLSLAKPEA